MTQNDTLLKYTVVTQDLKHYPINSHDLVGSVNRVTKWTAVCENNLKSLKPLTPKQIRNITKLDSSAVLYVLAHSSQDFSVIFTNTKKNLDSIIKSARKFAPQYSIRHIQQAGEPIPPRSLSLNPQMSELADVQWFIKAYFYQICDDRIEEKAMKQQTNSDKDLAPERSRESKTTSGNEIRQEKQGARKTKHDKNPEAPATGHIWSSSGGTKGPHLILPRPLLHPGYAQSALVSTARKRSRSPPPEPIFRVMSIPVAPSSVRDPSLQTKGNVSRRKSRMLQVSNECLGWVLEALEAAIPCLLELLDNDSSKPDSPPKSLVLGNEPPGFAALALLDPKIQARLGYVVALRRQIRDPSDPRLVAHDMLIQATVKDALTRIRKGK